MLPYDYVLLTDCVFSAALVPDLIRTILESSGQRSTVICVREYVNMRICKGYFVQGVMFVEGYYSVRSVVVMFHY